MCVCVGGGGGAPGVRRSRAQCTARVGRVGAMTRTRLAARPQCPRCLQRGGRGQVKRRQAKRARSEFLFASGQRPVQARCAGTTSGRAPHISRTTDSECCTRKRPHNTVEQRRESRARAEGAAANQRHSKPKVRRRARTQPLGPAPAPDYTRHVLRGSPAAQATAALQLMTRPAVSDCVSVCWGRAGARNTTPQDTGRGSDEATSRNGGHTQDTSSDSAT